MKKSTFPRKPADMASGAMTRRRLLAMLFPVATLLGGCEAMVVQKMAKLSGTDKTYEELAASLPGPADGKGRLYIYRTEDSTRTSFSPNGFKKNQTLFTAHDTAYELIWEAYRYVDLPEGSYEVSCGAIVKEWNILGKPASYQKGERAVQVSVSSASESFVRLDIVEEGSFTRPERFQPVVVPAEQGRKELSKLPLQTGMMYIKGGKISDSSSK